MGLLSILPSITSKLAFKLYSTFLDMLAAPYCVVCQTYIQTNLSSNKSISSKTISSKSISEIFDSGNFNSEINNKDFIFDIYHNSKLHNHICKSCLYDIKLAPNSAEIENKLSENFAQDDFLIQDIYCFAMADYDNDLYNFDDRIDDRIDEIEENLDISNNPKYNRSFIRAIYNLKYMGNIELGRELGKLLAYKMIRDKINLDKYDLMLPIPLHKVKQRERGFNQAEIICQGIEKCTNLKTNTEILLRSKYTVSQTKLNKNQRKSSAKDVFRISDNNLVKNKHILLIDDVLTTGSTLNAAATCLMYAGAKQVDIAAVVRA